MEFNLHESQLEIFESPARFKVVAAGRRFGKSHLAAVELIVHALQMTNTAGYDIHDKEVYYIAPTFEQGKKIMWPKLKEMAKYADQGGVIESTVENVATLRLINGRSISIRGADRPDTLRGVGLSYVVMDEYAFMKEQVWSMIIRPALADVEGEALFIGTSVVPYVYTNKPPTGPDAGKFLQSYAPQSRTAGSPQTPPGADK